MKIEAAKESWSCLQSVYRCSATPRMYIGVLQVQKKAKGNDRRRVQGWSLAGGPTTINQPLAQPLRLLPRISRKIFFSRVWPYTEMTQLYRVSDCPNILDCVGVYHCMQLLRFLHCYDSREKKMGDGSFLAWILRLIIKVLANTTFATFFFSLFLRAVVKLRFTWVLHSAWPYAHANVIHHLRSVRVIPFTWQLSLVTKTLGKKHKFLLACATPLLSFYLVYAWPLSICFHFRICSFFSSLKLTFWWMAFSFCMRQLFDLAWFLFLKQVYILYKK